VRVGKDKTIQEACRRKRIALWPPFRTA
jgi:hypothetical protein